MQQVIEGMMGLFFLIVLTFTGIEIAGALVEASEAQAFKVEIMERLEDCNYDVDVINGCFREAQLHGFRITLRLYYSNGNMQNYQMGNVRLPEGCYVTGAQVAVKYNLEIPFLKIRKAVSITGITL